MTNNLQALNTTMIPNKQIRLNLNIFCFIDNMSSADSSMATDLAACLEADLTERSHPGLFHFVCIIYCFSIALLTRQPIVSTR